MTSFLVDWWNDRMYFERNKRDLEHQERLMSTSIMAMYNKPQAVINLQQLYDDVLWYAGEFKHDLIGPI